MVIVVNHSLSADHDHHRLALYKALPSALWVIYYHCHCAKGVHFFPLTFPHQTLVNMTKEALICPGKQDEMFQRWRDRIPPPGTFTEVAGLLAQLICVLCKYTMNYDERHGNE